MFLKCVYACVFNYRLGSRPEYEGGLSHRACFGREVSIISRWKSLLGKFVYMSYFKCVCVLFWHDRLMIWPWRQIICMHEYIEIMMVHIMWCCGREGNCRDGNGNEDGDGSRPRGMEMMLLLGGNMITSVAGGRGCEIHVQCYVGVWYSVVCCIEEWFLIVCGMEVWNLILLHWPLCV